MNFLANLLPALFGGISQFSGRLADEAAGRPKVSAWASIGIGVAGLLGYAPSSIKATILSLADALTKLASLV